MKNERKTLKTPFECNVPLTTLKKKKKKISHKKLFTGKLFERNNYI